MVRILLTAHIIRARCKVCHFFAGHCGVGRVTLRAVLHRCSQASQLSIAAAFDRLVCGLYYRSLLRGFLDREFGRFKRVTVVLVCGILRRCGDRVGACIFPGFAGNRDVILTKLCLRYRIFCMPRQLRVGLTIGLACRVGYDLCRALSDCGFFGEPSRCDIFIIFTTGYAVIDLIGTGIFCLRYILRPVSAIK